jgi:hypothetical protein
MHARLIMPVLMRLLHMVYSYGILDHRARAKAAEHVREPHGFKPDGLRGLLSVSAAAR